ncbi:protease modulator HflC [Plesiomonas sp.]|uniref:protease modulator HflC n=1 Tax=Plesiomonas sp. TaxID=2486279 RepID=UPI003F31D486
MNKFVIPAVIVAVLIGSSSLFVVPEGERGIMLRFGKVKRDSQDVVQVYNPGLHLKAPFFDSVKMLDARVQTMDDQADRFVTAEKKDLIVDSYVKWKIQDFGRYYLSTGGGNMQQAEALLKRKISDRLRSEIGSRTIKDIVSGSRGELMDDARNSLNTGADSASDLGIEVVDVRVKQINLPAEVSNSIYQRMRAERNAVAREHRSQGREQAEILKADVDRRVTVMQAEAESKARSMRGEGDATAAKIYADAYSKDPEFYAFIRSLKAYENSFRGKQDMMVLKPDSDFFKYMKTPTAQPQAQK